MPDMITLPTTYMDGEASLHTRTARVTKRIEWNQLVREFGAAAEYYMGWEVEFVRHDGVTTSGVIRDGWYRTPKTQRDGIYWSYRHESNVSPTLSEEMLVEVEYDDHRNEIIVWCPAEEWSDAISELEAAMRREYVVSTHDDTPDFRIIQKSDMMHSASITVWSGWLFQDTLRTHTGQLPREYDPEQHVIQAYAYEGEYAEVNNDCELFMRLARAPHEHKRAARTQARS